MYSNSRLRNLYFEWLANRVCDDYQLSEYEDLLRLLYHEEFTWDMERDGNRAADGLDLRSEFLDDNLDIRVRDFRDSLPHYCTVLEMLVALAIRCEDTIMSDPEIGNRTGKWFWLMIDNLELSGMQDSYFDEGYILNRLDIFMHRKYGRDGSGGALFRVPKCKKDFRKAEIWYQMNWYLVDLD